MIKNAISRIPVEGVTIGFIYWLAETHNLRGLKNEMGYGTKGIDYYPNRLKELLSEYHEKYPNGLTFNTEEI
jgi:hypothetical protein